MEALSPLEAVRFSHLEYLNDYTLSKGAFLSVEDDTFDFDASDKSVK